MQNNIAQSDFTQSISKEDIYAGFFTRLAAYLIDGLFLAACLAIPHFIVWILRLSSPDNFLTRELLFSFSLWNIIEYLLCTAYFVILTYTSGMTLGKKAMRIKVVTKDGEKLSLFTAIYRETIGKYLSSIVLYIGYLLIGIDKEKRGIHDILCDTRVIYSCKVVEYKQQKTIYTPIQPFVSTAPQGFTQVPPQGFNQTPPQNFYRAAAQGFNQTPSQSFTQTPPVSVPPKAADTEAVETDIIETETIKAETVNKDVVETEASSSNDLPV